MNKPNALPIVAVSVAWQIMDFVIHTIILVPTYAATPSLLRPEGERKVGLMMVVDLIGAPCYCPIVDRFNDGISAGKTTRDLNLEKS